MIGEKLSQLACLRSDRIFQRNYRTKSPPHLFEFFVRPTRSLARFPIPTFLLRPRSQVPLGSGALLSPFPQLLRDPYRAALSHRCSLYCLLDPPRGVGRKLHLPIGVVVVHRLHKRQSSLLQEILQRNTPPPS